MAKRQAQDVAPFNHDIPDQAILATRLIVDMLANGNFGRYCGVHGQRELKWHALDVAAMVFRAVSGRDAREDETIYMYNAIAGIYPLVRGGQHAEG